MSEKEASTSNHPSSSSSSLPLPSPISSLSSYLISLQSSLQPPTRNAASIPNSSDLSFHRTLDRKLATSLDHQSGRLLSLVSDVAQWASKEESKGSGSGKDKGKGKGREDVEEREDGKGFLTEQDLTKEGFSSAIGDLIDKLLEQSDICLDEYSGLVAPRTKNLKSLEAAVAVEASKPTFTNSLPTNGPLPSNILNAHIQPPPQSNFTTKPDNSSNKRWSRTLKLGKPNSIIPLGSKPPDNHGKTDYQFNSPKWGMYSTEGDPRENPYHFEIYKSIPPSFVFERPEPISPLEMDPNDPMTSTKDQPFKWVDSKKGLEELLDHLKEDRVKEIAIDLEHHNYRSFQGITCLMQLSTRWGDWILDTLSDQVRENAEMLNLVMTDVKKVKILHGADHDILWLQRDLGIYIVNLFDTYHSTNVLEFPAHGLAFLLARYCGFEADKRYQLADWRIRPLPKEMAYYARSDTHSLIYVYDRLRVELLETQQGENAIREVFLRSKNTATKMYAKEEWDESGESREGWKTVWKKWGGEASKGIDNRSLKQMGKEERLVRALHKWRDQLARDLDESPRYVLSIKHLLALASRAPITSGESLAVLSPAIQALRKRAPEIARTVKAEIALWEKDRKEEEERRRKELESQPSAMEGVETNEEDLGIGEKVERTSQMQESAKPSASASTSLFPSLVSSLWFMKSPPSDAAQQTAAPQTSSTLSNARALASSLFGGRNKRPVASTPAIPASASSSPARFVASSSSLLGKREPKSDPTPSKPTSLFASPPTQSTSESRSEIQAKLSEIQSSLEGSLRASLGSSVLGKGKETIESNGDVSMAEGDSSLLSQPENVAFVPRSQRSDFDPQVNQASTSKKTDENPIEIPSTAFVDGQDKAETDADVEGDQANSSSEKDEEVVQVGKKKKKTKPKWTKEEKKRKRMEAQDEIEGDASRIQDETSQGSSKKKSRRGNQESEQEAFVPFDYGNAVSVLDNPVPSSALSKNNKKERKGKDKDKKDKGKAKGKGKDDEKEKKVQSHSHERVASGPQPRKKNEMNNGNKSFTFGN